MSTAIVGHAVLYVERFGFSVIPMHDQKKKPLWEWKAFQEKRPTLRDILSWPPQASLAIVTGEISRIVVVDLESKEDAAWFWKELGQTSAIVQTRRGFHFYFRHPGQKVKNGQKIEGRYDVRGDGGYVMAPPSPHAEGEYRWNKPLVRVDDLPVFKMEWRPETAPAPHDPKDITDGERYIQSIQAIAGQGGHNETWRACQRLKDSGMTPWQAIEAMLRWNQTNAQPPWSEKELLHKIRGVYEGEV